MCWNATVSLNTYIFGLFACIFSYVNNRLDIFNFLFIQSWMSIQLIEYFIWSKTFSNRVLSQVAFILIVLQPVFGILAASTSQTKYIYLALYICFAAVTMVLNPWSKIDFSSTPASNGHLAWNWLNFSIPYMIIWFFFLSIKFVANKQWIIYALVCISLVVTYLLYHKTKTWGSLWCWLANLASFAMIYDVFYNDINCYLKNKQMR